MPGKTSDNLLRLKDMNGKYEMDVDDKLLIMTMIWIMTPICLVKIKCKTVPDLITLIFHLEGEL